MDDLTRREFLEATATTGVGLGTGLYASQAADVQRPTRTTTVFGLPLWAFVVVAACTQKNSARPDCEVAYLCDVDESSSRNMCGEVEQIQHRAPKVTGDFRRALDDKSVDAIIVATPDHWHALATIWGCQAGKDVYVEKPVSHSPWEGRKMVEAARRYDRIVQVGTQNRSAPYNIAAKEYIDERQAGLDPHGPRDQSEIMAQCRRQWPIAIRRPA